MLHSGNSLYHRSVFLKRGYIESHRLLIKITFIFNESLTIQVGLKRRSERIAVVVGIMVLTFATKEEFGTGLWARGLFLFDDAQRFSRYVIYCPTPHLNAVLLIIPCLYSHVYPLGTGRATCRSLSQTSGGGGNTTPPSMYCVRCVGIPLEIQRRRQYCTKAVPFHCVSVCPASYTFTQRYPNAATATVAHHRPHAGNLSSRPCRQDGNEYTPFPRRFQAGNAVFGNCGRINPTHIAKTQVFGIVGGAVRAVFAFVRRQDGGSPCGSRGATALPSEAARAPLPRMAATSAASPATARVDARPPAVCCWFCARYVNYTCRC